MRTTLHTLSLAALLLSSCGIHNSYKPATTVPDDLYGLTDTELAATDTASIGNISWRQFFTDTCLQALIERGLANNTDLLTARLRVEEAEASLTAARLSFLPSLALAPQGTISSFDGGKATKSYTLPVTASWEVDIFGRLRNAKRQTQAALAQSREYTLAIQTQLIAAIANNYYTLLMLDDQLEIATATEQSWKESVDATRALMDAGLTNEAALSQTEATYYSISTTVLDLRNQIDQVENSLSLLLAETPRTIARGRLSGQALPTHLSVGIPLQMLSTRPDVKSAELALEQAFYATNQARSAFYPSLILSGTAGWTNAAGSLISNPAKFLATAVGSLTQPLFNRGANVANLKIAKAKQEEATLNFRQALLNAGSEVNDALSQYQTARSKTTYYDKQIASLERATESTSLLMEHGNTTYLEVLVARQSLLNARLTQVSNRFVEIQSIINLYQALGGGRS